MTECNRWVTFKVELAAALADQVRKVSNGAVADFVTAATRERAAPRLGRLAGRDTVSVPESVRDLLADDLAVYGLADEIEPFESAFTPYFDAVRATRVEGRTSRVTETDDGNVRVETTVSAPLAEAVQQIPHYRSLAEYAVGAVVYQLRQAWKDDVARVTVDVPAPLVERAEALAAQNRLVSKGGEAPDVDGLAEELVLLEFDVPRRAGGEGSE
jgi:hypothetical protein